MLAIREEFNSLLEKEMSRKEFLALIGVGLVAMTGLASLLKALNSTGSAAMPPSFGYGSSPYGGQKHTSKN